MVPSREAPGETVPQTVVLDDVVHEDIRTEPPAPETPGPGAGAGGSAPGTGLGHKPTQGSLRAQLAVIGTGPVVGTVLKQEIQTEEQVLRCVESSGWFATDVQRGYGASSTCRKERITPKLPPPPSIPEIAPLPPFQPGVPSLEAVEADVKEAYEKYFVQKFNR